MDGPSPGKNEDKGTAIDSKKIVVPKDEEDVFMSIGEEVPTLLPTVYDNEMLISLKYS